MTTGEIVEQSKEYIKKNIERSLTVAEIAGAVGYSEYYFSRLFKNETRTSVMEYVKREKLQRASVEIRSGKKIMDAALKYGWESHNGFTKAFKKEFGYCPALLRAMVISMQRLGGKSMGRTVNGRVDEHATKEQLFEILKKKVIQMYPSVDEKRYNTFMSMHVKSITEWSVIREMNTLRIHCIQLFCWRIWRRNTIRSVQGCFVTSCRKGLWTEKNLRNTWQRKSWNWL